MEKSIRISKAFVSVYHKASANVLFKQLHKLGIEIFTTIANSDLCSNAGIEANIATVSEIYHLCESEAVNIDLIILDFPTLDEFFIRQRNEETIFENIDTQHIALMRMAAKNFRNIMIIPSVRHFGDLYKILGSSDGYVSFDERRKMAFEAFNVSSGYDVAIYNHFKGEFNTNVFKESISGYKELKYGENPHQKSVFYGDFDGMFEQLNGGELSYNNLLDINSAVDLIAEFKEPTAIISKHTIPSGAGSDISIAGALRKSVSADPVSAFWSTITLNRYVDEETAEILNGILFANLIAPGFHPKALDILKKRTERKILKQKDVRLRRSHFRSLLNGVIVQDKDYVIEEKTDMNVVTKQLPSEQEFEDLIFANKVVKHSKSNAVVLVRNKQLIANGNAQTSRVDALRLAISKAESYGIDLVGCIAASDAFFPFVDSVEIAYNAGIGVIIQVVGSDYQDEAIRMCDENKIAMVLINNRHFKH